MAHTARQQAILAIVEELGNASISQIKERLAEPISTPTLNRELAALVTEQYLLRLGQGRATRYQTSGFYELFAPVDLDEYFNHEPDHRKAQTRFQEPVFKLLEEASLFSPEEHQQLKNLKTEYQKNIADYPPTLYQKELERLTIELSWKSAQIEGNTYSLLETEQLFREKESAKGKPQSDATMLLNHKDALDYILAHPVLAKALNLRFIEEIHSLLIKELGVSRNLRSRVVGITGTAYKPLDNAYQIREAMERMCSIINGKATGAEKALLAVCLLSYIQPFEDGNERTARMISNALLIADGFCPLSYRSVEAIDYKKAMLLFYEQNKLSAFKMLFMEQIAFSVTNYFR